MEKRLWEYRTQSPNEVTASLFSRQHGIAQLMQFSDGTLLLHTIDEGDSAASAPVNAVNLESDLPFTLLPEAFQDSGIPGWQGLTQKASLDGTVVCYAIEDKNSIHAALPLYKLAAEAAKQGDVVYCYSKQDRCIVFVFRNGHCELANSYPVQGESEIMYFCLAAARKSGADLKQIQIKILGNDTRTLVQALERFGVQASSVQLELPYPAGEYPPYPAESFLLCQLLTCALPEGN